MMALVTGGGGYLGLYLVEQLLAKGLRVRSFSRNRYASLEQLGVEQILGDLRDREAVRRACQSVTTVFHTAAIAGIWGSWKSYFEINTLGTSNVIHACRNEGVARLVYTSSPSVTFSGDDQQGVDEMVPYPLKFWCHYSHSKALAEKEVLASNTTNGLLTCALRPHLIWGPRDNHLVPRLIARARSGKLRRVGSGKNLIDMIYVENAARAHLQASEALTPGSPVAGQAYFLSQGTPVNCWNWIDDLLQLAGLPKLNRGISYPVAYAAGATLEALYWLGRRNDEPRMTRFLAMQLAKHHYFDISKARRDFGYEPLVSTEEGMRRLGEELRTAAK